MKDQFVLRQSLIKTMMYDGQLRSNTDDPAVNIPRDIGQHYCPRSVKAAFIDNLKSPHTDAMMKGSYGEYICGVNPFSEIADLPRHKKTRVKLIDQRRIDDNVMEFKRLCEERNISRDLVQLTIAVPYFKGGLVCHECGTTDFDISVYDISDIWPKVIYDDEGNVNYHATRNYNDQAIKKRYIAQCKSCGTVYYAIDIALTIMKGTIDIFSPFLRKGKNEQFFKQANIDMKWTGQIKKNFGEYQWGDPDKKWHIQFIMYDYILRLLGFNDVQHVYLVYTWLSDDSRIFDFKPDANHLHSLEENIRLVFRQLSIDLSNGWPTNPQKLLCDRCPLSDECEDAFDYNERTIY